MTLQKAKYVEGLAQEMSQLSRRVHTAVMEIQRLLELPDDVFLSPRTPVPDKAWSEFGQAVTDAIRDGYCVDTVLRATTINENWRPSARRVWEIGLRVGARPKW